MSFPNNCKVFSFSQCSAFVFSNFCFCSSCSEREKKFSSSVLSCSNTFCSFLFDFFVVGDQVLMFSLQNQNNFYFRCLHFLKPEKKSGHQKLLKFSKRNKCSEIYCCCPPDPKFINNCPQKFPHFQQNNHSELFQKLFLYFCKLFHIFSKRFVAEKIFHIFYKRFTVKKSQFCFSKDLLLKRFFCKPLEKKFQIFHSKCFETNPQFLYTGSRSFFFFNFLNLFSWMAPDGFTLPQKICSVPVKRKYTTVLQ